MVELDTALNILQTISIVIGIAYYLMILNNQQKSQKQTLETRQAQLFMQIYNRLTHADFTEKWNEVLNYEWTDFDDFIHQYGQKNNPKTFSTIQSIELFFEGIGVLVSRGLIDVSLVDDVMSNIILLYWRKYGKIAHEMRIQYNLPQYAEWTEYLYNEVRKVAVQQHPELAT
jgi:hypothetical protein